MATSSGHRKQSRGGRRLGTSKSDAREKIAKQIRDGYALLGRSIGLHAHLEDARRDYLKWDSYNAELIRYVFDDEAIVREYRQSTSGTPNLGGTARLDELVEGFKTDVKEKISRLETMDARLELFLEPSHQELVGVHGPNANTGRRDVFVVHGQDETAKQVVARLLEHLDLNPIILHEQENRGRTIIEKLEGCSAGVGFAVVLLTPDDVGAAKADKDSPKPRARQNVVFELGFFVAALGRARVCALHKGDIEIPSDYKGVAYIQMDEAGAWKIPLVREIRAAGIHINPDKLLGR